MTGFQKRVRYSFLGGVALLTLLLSACAGIGATQNQSGKSGTSVLSNSNGGNTSAQSVTYSTKTQDVLLRTFYGGGSYGSLQLSPSISLYGDGTYIFGVSKLGKLGDNGVQTLLHTITDTNGLLNFKRQQFSDIQDQNATFLQVTLNGKTQEFMYGSFGNQQESTQDMDEYHRLERVLTTITETLNGPTQPYKSNDVIALVHLTSSAAQQTLTWPLSDFSLAQAAAFECGLQPKDETSKNPDTGCLKFLIPHNAILLNAAQAQALRGQLPAQQGSLQQGVFTDGDFNYIVALRPLLPDELLSKSVAMLGSAQSNIVDVPLLNGQVPPVPTPTASK